MDIHHFQARQWSLAYKEGVWAMASSCLAEGGYLGPVLLTEPLAGVGHGKQGQVEEGTGGADVEVVGEELPLDGAEGVAREVPAHHKPCQGESR